MSTKLQAGLAPTRREFEDAVILDDMTATYAAAFATVCAGLRDSRAAPGDAYVALRLAQQMRTAAAAFWAGQRLDDAVWVPADATEQ